MTDKNLYALSNKIRSILLTTIDKEILANSKKNHLLLNSQTQEQLMKKFVNYQDFTMESEESFEGKQNNEDNFYDFQCSYSNNKLNFSCHSSRKNGCLFPQNFIDKISHKRNSENPKISKFRISKISENDLYNLKKNSGKKLILKMKPSSSCKEIIDFKSLSLLNNDNFTKYKKKFSADLYNYSAYNKHDDTFGLINYCYKLKKPNEEIINEISDDDSPTNQNNIKNHLFPYRKKNNHKNFSKKKLKKTINKKRSCNKINHNNDESPLRTPIRKKITNSTNEIKIYSDKMEKSNQNEKIKNQNIKRKLSMIASKESSTFHWKNILQLNHYKSKSPEKKLKGRKTELQRKISSMQVIKVLNKKTEKKKLRHFKSIDPNHLILKHKDKKGKKEKNDAAIAVNAVCNIQFQRSQFRKSKTICKDNGEFQQNEMFCFGKKIWKNNVNKSNESTNEIKKIDILNINYNHKIVHKNDSIKNKQNLKKVWSTHKINFDKSKN